MDLKDFIRGSLSQIVQGIIEANEAIEEKDAAVNPANVEPNQKSDGPYGWLQKPSSAMYYNRAVESVNFDLVVTVTEGKKTKGGVGVAAGLFVLGSQGKSENERASESRLRFRIPLLLPTSKNTID